MPAAFEILDERFSACIDPAAELERLHGGGRWLEGPVWTGDGLIFSDVPGDVMWRWDAASARSEVFRRPSGYANGSALDREGRLLTCQHGGRCVTRTEHDGAVRVLIDRYDGMRLNSPNDVVVRSDGSIWFTDPTYGIASDTEGVRAESEIGACHVYRAGPDGEDVRVVADGFDMPNGLAFSPDESLLYVADSGGAEGGDRPRHIRVFEVAADGSLRGGDVLATCTDGVFDGFRVDADGRIWSSAHDGVHCIEPDGTLIGKVAIPERVGNVAFGGPDGDRLFVCASSSLYALTLRVRGAPRPGRAAPAGA